MKNQVLPKPSFYRLLIIFLASAVLVSCSKDDEEEDTPTPQDVTFRIDLVKIVALTISDAESDYLEVYGSVNSKLKRDNITEENLIWSAQDDNYISVGMSDTPLSETFTYSVQAQYVETSDLEVIVSLSEHDFSESNPDEFLGTETISIPLTDISGTVSYDMVLDESSQQIVRLTYSITRE